MKNKTRTLSLSVLFAVLGASILLIGGTAVSAQEDMKSGDTMMSGDTMNAVRNCIYHDAMMSGDAMKSGDAMMSGDNMMSGDAMKSGDAMMSGDTSVKTYKVTVTNITPGQSLTPPLLVTHSADVGIFALGEEASGELQQLAENGNPDPLKEKLGGTSGVCDIVTGESALVPATHPSVDDDQSMDFMADDDNMVMMTMSADAPYTATYEIVADYKHQYLSFVSMLICTNDGFAGLSGVHLPSSGEEMFLAVSYDAGTEKNTQDFADLVPPCQTLSGISSDDEGTGHSNPDTAEHGIVIPHPGVFPGEDLTSAHAWADPVAIVTVSLVE